MFKLFSMSCYFANKNQSNSWRLFKGILLGCCDCGQYTLIWNVHSFTEKSLISYRFDFWSLAWKLSSELTFWILLTSMISMDIIDLKILLSLTLELWIKDEFQSVIQATFLTVWDIYLYGVNFYDSKIYSIYP